METACIILGKTGDIFSGLPIVRALNAILVTSAQYAPVVAAIPGFQVDVYQGHWQDLSGAYQWAKRRFPKVLIAQAHGREFPIAHTAPSWQYDQWARAGMLESFGKLPLVIPRSGAHGKSDKPVILIASESESSPFPHKERLWQMVRGAFGSTHEIINLCAIKRDRITELLPLYDAADCLVTVDTAHLHLSAASEVPTVAIVTSKPQLWHGSAWSKRFLAHIRYHEFEQRAEELLRALRGAVEKRPAPRLIPCETHFRNAYNPSITDFNGKRLMTFRYHPDRDKWRTILAMWDGQTTQPIQVPKELQAYSWEDGRLFTHDGKLWISYVLSQYPSTPARCIVGYSQLVHEGHAWKVKEHFQPMYPGNDFGGTTKNWLFFSIGGKLHAITGSTPQQSVVELSGKRVVREYKTPMPPGWNYGEIRGGALVMKGDRALRFFHSKTGNGHKYYEFRYHIGKAEMELQPPFKTLYVDPTPVISGNEMWVPDCKHWKPNVVFPGGAVLEGDKVLLAVGWNDCRCAMMEVDV